MSLKWYFAISESSIGREDHDWRGLIRVAVESARQKTHLRPNMLYDGNPNDFTKELEQKDVNIIYHKVSFYDELEIYSRSQSPVYLPTASGTFLRTDIPLIETDEEFVLYTDCDVMFLAEIPALRCQEPFAVAPESEPGSRIDINAGVMLMNLPLLRNSCSEFHDFIRNNLEKLHTYDQTAYQIFYDGRLNNLEPWLNWRPYWGHNEGAVILHWHGPKPIAVRRLLDEPSAEMPSPAWPLLFAKDPDSYRRYLSIWDAFSVDSLRTKDGTRVFGEVEFDANIYLSIHRDVAESGMDPEEHYLKYGRYEGRRLR
jgi:hypothetical protein